MISAVIITLNEAANIGDCLASLQGIVEEIIVVDAESTDETEAICRSFDVRFFSKSWESYSANKNFGNAQASHPYIFSIDADERVSKELKASLLQAKKNLSGAYRFPRKNFYCGKWIKHAGWYPDHKLRLFPKASTQWKGGFVHETLDLEEGVQVQTLAGDLLHFTNHSLEDHLSTIQTYADLHAKAMYAKGIKPNWLRLWLVPMFRFFRMYMWKQGFRDGYLGFQLCKVSAFAVFLKYAKLKRLWDE